jgi:exodeoxyribonuclease X
MKKLLFVDTETTDLDDGHLIELGIGDETSIEVIRCRPHKPISYSAMGIHHITEGELVNLEYFQQREDYEDLKRRIRSSIFVAHNAKFDISVLFREGIEVTEFIDTKQVAKHLLPDAPDYRLQTLRYFLHCDISETSLAHSAEGDVRVLMNVFNKLKDIVLEKYPDKDPIQMMTILTDTPILLDKFTFGKHRGKTYSEINKTDRGYIEWLFKSNHDDPDVKHTVAYWMSQKSI